LNFNVLIIRGKTRAKENIYKWVSTFEGEFFFVHYESIKRELKIRPIYECRCDERLKTKTEESTRLAYTWFLGELEHLKIMTRLIDEKLASVMGECVFVKLEWVVHVHRWSPNGST